MGRTPFFRILNELERVHLLMIELEHLNFDFEKTDIEPKRPSLDLLNYSSNRLKHQFFEHQTDSNMFIQQKTNSNALFLASN